MKDQDREQDWAEKDTGLNVDLTPVKGEWRQECENILTAQWGAVAQRVPPEEPQAGQMR